MKKPRWKTGVVWYLRRRSGALAEVEGGSCARAERDFHALAVVGVHGQAGRGQDDGNGDRAAEGVANATSTGNAVDVELHRRASLRTLDHVLDHAGGQSGVVIGGVNRGGTRAVGKAGDVSAERRVLADFLTDGGDVDLRAGDLEAPLTDGTNDFRGGVRDLESVRCNGGAVVSDGDSRATGGSRHLQHAGAGGVGNHVVGGTSGDAGGEGAATGSAGVDVDDAELDGVADFEVQIGRNGDFVIDDVNSGFTEGCGSASRGVVEGAGGARKDGGHRKYLKG